VVERMEYGLEKEETKSRMKKLECRVVETMSTVLR
jgi:hypothetical protein